MTGPTGEQQSAGSWWSQNLPRCSPSAPEKLRVHLRNRWVRIHHLPQSKRYPETVRELDVAMARHLAVIGSLFDASGRVWLSGCTYPTESQADGTLSAWRPEHSELWSATTADEGAAIALWLLREDADSAVVADVLHQVIFERASRVCLFAADSAAVYHPYDGGGDIIAESPEHAETLRQEFAEWLSERADGL